MVQGKMCVFNKDNIDVFLGQENIFTTYMHTQKKI